MSSIVEIRVGDKIFKELISFTLVKSMLSLSGAVIFEVTDFTKEDKKFIYIGDSFTVSINGTSTMIGIIETIQYSSSDKQSKLIISGRDNGQIIDSCWGRVPSEWKNITIRSLIAELCTPFGITVISEESALSLTSTLVKSFSISGREKVGDAIRRICVENCIIPFSYGDKNLTLTAGTIKNFSLDTIKDANVLETTIKDTSVDRYGTYIVKGTGYPDQNKLLVDFVQPSSKITDSIIDVNKTNIILSDIETDSGKCTSRAYFDKNIKSALATAEEYTIKNIVQSNDKPWNINTIITVIDYLGENSSKLICEIRLQYNKDSQCETSMTVVHRDAFTTKNVQIKGKFSR
ncbi:MAG: hypothetical protein WC346_15600 [Methanogenium sp.]|jgi:prophage tail gpP-like protein